MLHGKVFVCILFSVSSLFFLCLPAFSLDQPISSVGEEEYLLMLIENSERSLIEALTLLEEQRTELSLALMRSQNSEELIESLQAALRQVSQEISTLKTEYEEASQIWNERETQFNGLRRQNNLLKVSTGALGVGLFIASIFLVAGR